MKEITELDEKDNSLLHPDTVNEDNEIIESSDKDERKIKKNVKYLLTEGE